MPLLQGYGYILIQGDFCNIYIYIYIYIYTLCEQDAIQGQFLSGVLTCLNSEFSFS